MPKTAEEATMRCSLRTPGSVLKSRRLRKCWSKNSSLLLVFASAYVFVVLFDTGRVLTGMMRTDEGSKPSEINTDGASIAALSKKMKSLIDNKKIHKLDLSVSINDVRFKENRRKLLCFEWVSVKEKIQDHIRKEQELSYEENENPSSRPYLNLAENEIVPNLLNVPGNSGSGGLYPDHAGERKINPKIRPKTAEEPGLLMPVSPGAAALRALYRYSIKHASDVINNNVDEEPITACSFPGFSQQESQLIWTQAARSVRIQHSCKRYTAILYPTDASQEAIWDSRNNLGYCHQAHAGPNIWLDFLLNWGGEKVSSAAADGNELEDRVQQLYPPLPHLRMKDLLRHNPLIFTVVGHPFERIVMAYVDHIRRHYRSESSPSWIRDIRGKTFQELTIGIRGNILSSYPVLATRGVLNQLLIPENGFGKYNKIRRHANSTDTRLNFREFVWLAIKQNLECFNNIDCLSKVDRLWRPQYIWCSPCSIKFDLIIKDESFQKDSSLLLKLLGKPDIVIPTNVSIVPVTKSSSKNVSRDVNNSEPNSDDDSSTSGPAVLGRKQDSFSNATSSHNSTDDNTVTKEPEATGELDPYEINEEIRKDLPREELVLDYISSLTYEELKMLFITYTYDFTLFGFAMTKY